MAGGWGCSCWGGGACGAPQGPPAVAADRKWGEGGQAQIPQLVEGKRENPIRHVLSSRLPCFCGFLAHAKACPPLRRTRQEAAAGGDPQAAAADVGGGRG